MIRIHIITVAFWFVGWTALGWTACEIYHDNCQPLLQEKSSK